MANPWIVAAAAKVVGSQAARGAAGAVGASRIYKLGRFAGKRQTRTVTSKSLKQAGVKKAQRKAIMRSTVKPPTTVGGQAAAVATSVPGSAAIGAAGVAGYGHWKNQPRDSQGRWTR